MGHSAGRWEGDTLVVKVTNFNDRTWLSRQLGNLASEHLVTDAGGFYLAFAVLLGPELPTLGGALLGGTLFAVALRRSARGGPAPDASDLAAGSVVRALAPYLVLVLLVLATRAVVPLGEVLGSLALAQWGWPAIMVIGVLSSAAAAVWRWRG